MRTALKFGMSINEFWECDNRELDNFIRAKVEQREEQIEQEWDYTRSIIWAIFQCQTEKKLRVTDFVKLKRDGNRADLTPYENQELKKWNAKMDEGMTLVPLFPNK